MTDNILTYIRFFSFFLLLGLTTHKAVGHTTVEVFSVVGDAAMTFSDDTPMQLSGRVLRGDANEDGIINMFDVVTAINYILGNNPKAFNFKGADTTGDGIISMMDVIGIINIILKGDPNEGDDPRLPTDDPDGGDPGTGV